MAWREKRKVMGRYDASAETYEQLYCEEQHRKYAKALESVDVSGALALDVGCGSGMFFGEIADKAQIVVGADVSHKLLLKAKAQAKKFGNVFVVQADADHLPFCSGFFGAVFAFTVLQNMPKPAETLTELKRVIQSGGKVAVTGLKKAFPLDKFMDLLEGSGMRLVTFTDEEAINCYITVLSA